jgi:hypothetical protein
MEAGERQFLVYERSCWPLEKTCSTAVEVPEDSQIPNISIDGRITSKKYIPGALRKSKAIADSRG